MQIEEFDLGLIDFKNAWDFQKEAFKAVKYQQIPSALILCQHNPVITISRTADRRNILINEAELHSRGIQIYEIERGGDVTYHGPGQIIAYPVFNLRYFQKDIHKFLRYLEGIAIDLLSDFGISAETIPGLTGVWVEGRKIASIGIAIRQWITFHGLSINIKKNDLENFSLIKPCGMDIEMTSLEDEAGRDIEIESVKQSLTYKFRGTTGRPAFQQAGRNDYD